MSNEKQWEWLNDPAYNRLDRAVLKQTIEELTAEYQALEGDEAYETFHERLHEVLENRLAMDLDQDPDAVDLLAQHIWHMSGVHQNMIELVVGMFTNSNGGDPYCYEATYQLMMQNLAQED